MFQRCIKELKMDIIIFANGVIAQPAEWLARQVRPEDLIIAANGGTRHALAAGLMPHHVIGDLDSLPADLRTRLTAQGTIFHPHPPAKNETDLELALLWAASGELGVRSEALGVASGEVADRRISESAEPPSALSPQPSVLSPQIVILGALGGRPDQALANLLLLALPPLAGLDVVIVDGAWQIRCLRGGETLRLRGQPGDTLSLIPLGGPAEGVVTSGLAYPLREETLHFGPARGVSNVFTGETVAVTLSAGLLWCFHHSAVV